MRTLRAVFLAFLGTAIAGVALVSGLVAGPVLEGRITPVVGPLMVTSVASDERGGVVLAGTGRKLRDCTYWGVEWFLGKRDGGSARVPFQFTEPPRVNGPGVLVWTGIDVGLSEAQLAASYADVLHRCHPLWLTRTRWWQ